MRRWLLIGGVVVEAVFGVMVVSGPSVEGPAVAAVVAPSSTPVVPPCNEEDGSGSPLPCRWDSATAGLGPEQIAAGEDPGRSFTVVPIGDPVNGEQLVAYRYDDGGPSDTEWLDVWPFSN